ncbi:MAG: hypothetical protein GX881_01940 [Firmicutes bacterium]|nr:hypothetical protein [Bacillota bacterium]
MEAAVLGLLFAFFYDFYRAVRLRLRRFPPLLSAAADCIFWLAAAVAAVLFFAYRRWGEIYMYIYIGLAGGFICYLRYLSRYILPLWQRSLAFLARFLARLPGKRE